ncbi:ATP-binding protein [Cnuibacter sp. UC19_7]|uniref:ATP-binding protein n=1 Tax=Cnuibacter sp. UC19_7 TaxID=3350166 RepID=UPI00366E5BCC
MVVLLIDGPSGSGKTDLAATIARRWSDPQLPQVVHLDDIYPGWGGLRAASEHVVDELLRPLRDGGAPRWQRWDWERGELAEWHDVDPERPLIVEGCGALSRASAPLADLTIWVETDDVERRRRALARDGEVYETHWDEWERQWTAFVVAEHPRSLATLIIPT